MGLKPRTFTRYQAEPGNANGSALPPLFLLSCEPQPLDIGSQAEPRNQLNQLKEIKNYDSNSWIRNFRNTLRK
jgi:hypothetical protein